MMNEFQRRVTPMEDSGSEVKKSQNSKAEAEQERQAPPFLEVLCQCSGKIRRFSVGTEAGFAVSLINKKLINDGGGNGSLATYIEASKEGEEPISFGPSSLLADYGSGWKLQTVVESQGERKYHIEATQNEFWKEESYKGANDPNSKGTTQSPFTLVYIGKILLAFLVMFVFGAIFTLALENLPRFILYINSFL